MLPSAASLLDGDAFEPSVASPPLLEELMFCDSNESDSQPLPRAQELLGHSGSALALCASPGGCEGATFANTAMTEPVQVGEPWVAASEPWPSGALPGYDEPMGGVSPNLSKSRLARRWLSKFDDLEDSRSSIDLTQLGKVLEDEPSPVSIMEGPFAFAEWPARQDVCVP